MRADEFVWRIRAAAPTEEDLRLQGYSAATIAEEARGYACPARSGGAPEADALVDLVSRYDTTRLVIGFVEFNATDIPNAWLRPGRTIVARWESDPIAVMQGDGRVVLIDHANPDSAYRLCAVDGSHFLDAMWRIFEFGRRHPYRPGQTPEDKAFVHGEALKEVAMCAEAAGLATDAPNPYEELLGCGSR